MRRLILIVSLLFFSISIFSQDGQPSKNRAANNHYERANAFLQSNNIEFAKRELVTAIELDSTFVDAYLFLAEIFDYHSKNEEKKFLYKKLANINGDIFPESYGLVADMELKDGNYAEAKLYAQKSLGNEKSSLNLKKYCEGIIKKSEFAIEAINNPVPFTPVNLGSNVNSENDEYLPALTADENKLVITRKILKLRRYSPDDTQEDFFESLKVGDEWGTAVKIEGEINTENNEGAQSITVDGNYLFFTACNRPDGVGGCDIYFSKKINGKWSVPFNLGQPINTKYWESQPSISVDGRTLYFSTNRPGGKGETDIWKSTLNDDGSFSEPLNLGDTINTLGIENSPFIHQDNQTLYFASNGHTGMGGLDIFLSRKDSDGKWQKPENLGYPINTFKNEGSLIVNAKGDKAYFASEREGGFGKQDLYEFDLYEKARPVLVTYLKGKVYDVYSKEHLQATFELIDIETGITILKSYSDKNTGEFLVCLASNKNYALNVAKQGYLFHSENFSLKKMDDPGKPYLMDIALHPIKTGEKVVLRNIFFKTDSYDLMEESKVELDKLIAFMNENPGVRIEIGGHTDNVGNDEYNQVLSLNRAKSVYNYLINNSIPENRLVYKGYGEIQPIGTNETESGRSANRRTEFKILD